MSWLPRSIANSLRIDDDDDDDDHRPTTTSKSNNHLQEEARQQQFTDDDQDGRLEDNQGRGGVKEDLSEFTDTITRQLWGVASFLASPPSHHQPDPSVSDRNQVEYSVQSGSVGVSDDDASDFVGDAKARVRDSDAGWRFQNGSVSEPECPVYFDDGDAVGITEEVLAFARNIAHHPETWLDFPLYEEDDMDDFDMSDAQCKHAMVIERQAPRLAALRFELCPAHMSDGYFWKVYFVLLHSRLNKHDDELLSTPQVVAARGMWMQELQKKTKPQTDWFGGSTLCSRERKKFLEEDYDPTSYDTLSEHILRSSDSQHTPRSATTEPDTEKHPIVSNEIQVSDKSVIEEQPVIKATDRDFVAGLSYNLPVQDYDDDDDDWLEENSELDGFTTSAIHLGTDEDISFSDLEDDDDCTMPVLKTSSKDCGISTKNS